LKMRMIVRLSPRCSTNCPLSIVVAMPISNCLGALQVKVGGQGSLRPYIGFVSHASNARISPVGQVDVLKD
jgi:hypothetical protein